MVLIKNGYSTSSFICSGLAKSARHQQTNKTQNHDAINEEIRAGSMVVTEL